MRSAIIFLAIVAYVYGETLNLFLYEELPELYKEFIPEHLFERLRLVYKNSDKQHLQETAKQIIGKFKDLKEDYRLDLKTHFIRIYEYIQDSKFEELANGAFQFVNGEILNLFLYEELPELYKEFIPEHVRKFFTTLSIEEKILIREFATKTGDFSKKSDDQVWELLKTKNLDLYKKAFEVRTLVEKKIDNLKPEAKNFIEFLFERLRLVYKNSDKQHLQETAKQIIGKFKDLKEDYRLDLKTHFIRIYEYIQDSKFEELAKGIFRFVDGEILELVSNAHPQEQK